VTIFGLRSSPGEKILRVANWCFGENYKIVLFWTLWKLQIGPLQFWWIYRMVLVCLNYWMVLLGSEFPQGMNLYCVQMNWIWIILRYGNCLSKERCKWKLVLLKSYVMDVQKCSEMFWNVICHDSLRVEALPIIRDEYLGNVHGGFRGWPKVDSLGDRLIGLCAHWRMLWIA